MLKNRNNSTEFVHVERELSDELFSMNSAFNSSSIELSLLHLLAFVFDFTKQLLAFSLVCSIKVPVHRLSQA